MGRVGTPDHTISIVLLVVLCVQTSHQQIIDRCADTDTFTVTFPEADNKNIINADPGKYRISLGVNADTTNIRFNPEPDVAPRINPFNYLSIVKGSEDGRNQWFLQLREPVDRDGTRPETFDDLPTADFAIICNDTDTYYRLLRVLFDDVNDNAPVFLQSPYRETVNELRLPGTTVYQVSATDLDNGENKDVEFSVEPYTPDLTLDGSSFFFIPVPKLGYVETTKLLDFETQRTYIVNITATDKGTRPQSSWTTLTINVTDGDDQDPIFQYPTCLLLNGKCFDPRYTTNFGSGSDGQMLFSPQPASSEGGTVLIQARDQDSLNHPIEFRIEAVDPITIERDNFEVRTSNESFPLHTATVTVVRGITRTDALREIRLVLMAVEQTERRHSAAAILSITLEPTNSSPPQVTATDGLNTGTIREDATSGSYVRDSSEEDALRLIVTDPDVLELSGITSSLWTTMPMHIERG